MPTLGSANNMNSKIKVYKEDHIVGKLGVIWEHFSKNKCNRMSMFYSDSFRFFLSYTWQSLISCPVFCLFCFVVVVVVVVLPREFSLGI